jgi:uncharacterized protein (TIRG00374 family)
MKEDKHGWWMHAVGLTVGIGIVVWLIYHSGFGRFWQLVSRVSLSWLGVAILLYALSWAARTWRLRLFTRQAGKELKIGDLFKLQVSGFALNVLLPAKLGDLAFIGYLKMQGLRLGRAAAIALQNRILDLLAVLLLALPGMCQLLRRSLASSQFAPRWIAVSFALGLTALLAVSGLVILDRRLKLSRLLRRWGEGRQKRWLRTALFKIDDAYVGYHEIVRDRRLLGGSVLLSLIIWCFEALTCLTVVTALGLEISLAAVMLGICLANVGKSVPPIPGGLGIYEGILSAVLVLFGLPFEAAVAAAILDALLKKGFNLVWGIPATAVMGVQLKEVIGMARRANKDEG